MNFYSIDAETSAFSKKGYRVAGENATWDLENEILTISGSGAISIHAEDYYRRPVSSTAIVYVHPEGENGWQSIREHVKKIIIGEGITDIPERAFGYFDNLTEAEISPGVTSIGKEAFYKCESLSKITIPASVTSIGEDFLWAGYYSIFDDSHVVGAKKSTVSKNISNLAKGKKYYVRIRAYKIIDGKKCYGSWSKPVKVKSK